MQMKITVETTKTYTVELTEGDRQVLCNEINSLYDNHALNQFIDGAPGLKALQTILENPEHPILFKANT